MRSVPTGDLHVESNRATCTNEKCTKLRFIYMLKQTLQLAQMRSVPSLDLHVETSGATCTNEKCTKLRFTC